MEIFNNVLSCCLFKQFEETQEICKYKHKDVVFDLFFCNIQGVSYNSKYVSDRKTENI